VKKTYFSTAHVQNAQTFVVKNYVAVVSEVYYAVKIEKSDRFIGIDK